VGGIQSIYHPKNPRQSFRVRALQVYSDVWAQDLACYLTDEEFGLTSTPVPAT
jgi:hypothetical protein